MADNPESGAPSSVFGRRLAVTEVEPPSAADLGLDDLRKCAFEFQEQRQWAYVNELARSLKDSARAGWVRDVHGLLGVVGELVLVAIGAEIEKAACVVARDAIGGTTTDEKVHRAVLAQSLRFFAEGQGNYIVVTGHALANLTLRTMMLDASFKPPVKQLEIDKAKLVPNSRDRRAWTGLHSGTAAALLKASGRCTNAKMRDLASVLDAMVKEGRWDRLRVLRNEQYHRWRGESAGVTGVSIDGPSITEILQSGKAVQIGAEMLPEYTAGETVLTDVVRVSTEGLAALGNWLPQYLTAWHDAYQEVAK